VVTGKTRPRFFCPKNYFQPTFYPKHIYKPIYSLNKTQKGSKNQNQHAPKNIHAEKSTLSGKEMEKNT
jgi:hypothetical protein